ncbi:ester cyclase [Streptomyces sp. NPDC086081]|uniref:ester cyclase n=1 Tax=unclassified Streptomyces TaxID=2593676 RepID=UPI0037D5DED6
MPGGGGRSHIVEIVEFPSYEDAMRNSGLPETDRIFREMVALCEGTPTFTDLDVVRDEQLCAATAHRFSFTIEDQLAQGDRVCTRWTFHGRHTGGFLGIPPTGEDVTMTGTTVHRCAPDGKLAEGWWQYDRLGLMQQLGALEPTEL